MNIASYDLLQAIRGPVMLITLGTLIALDHFQGISFAQRTWPVLLIVFGVLKLLEKTARPPDYPAGPYSNPPGGVGAYPVAPPPGSAPGANTAGVKTV